MSIIKVQITKVRPNPYQPESRVNVPDDAAERMGKSILNFGMILTPVGRRTNGFFEMGDGWLRLKGHEWLVNHGHVEYRLHRTRISFMRSTPHPSRKSEQAIVETPSRKKAAR